MQSAIHMKSIFLFLLLNVEFWCMRSHLMFFPVLSVFRPKRSSLTIRKIIIRLMSRYETTNTITNNRRQRRRRKKSISSLLFLMFKRSNNKWKKRSLCIILYSYTKKIKKKKERASWKWKMLVIGLRDSKELHADLNKDRTHMNTQQQTGIDSWLFFGFSLVVFSRFFPLSPSPSTWFSMFLVLLLLWLARFFLV